LLSLFITSLTLDFYVHYLLKGRAAATASFQRNSGGSHGGGVAPQASVNAAAVDALCAEIITNVRTQMRRGA
jgi:hypothetical protein